MSEKVVLLNCGGETIAFHEERRHESLARIIAEIKNTPFAGKYDPSATGDSRFYFVPHYTIVGTELARRMGIRTPDDLFGGVVPHWFVRTKAIVHDLINVDAARPQGWQPGFADAIAGSVLPGYTAFSRADAYHCGLRLLQSGTIRVKDVFESGGLGQTVARNCTELEKVLSEFPTGPGGEFSVVLELNLEDIITYSIGQVYLDGMTVSYWGTQRTTVDNSGNTAYGGSDLTLARGDFDEVIAVAQDAETRRAIEAAQVFDRSASAHYPGIFVSRRNYDVARGHDSRGVTHCGVIDQSWRIGGTSGVEVAAVRIFKERQDIHLLKGSSFNVYGHDAPVPANALVHFEGLDDEFGPVLMYTIIDTP